MISILNVRSQTHNSCEDSVLVKENDSYIWGGVFDGCSTGIKSHWASQTFAYTFGKYGNPTVNGNLLEVRKDLVAIMETLGINYMNLLSTCVLFCYTKLTKLLEIRVFGDGCYYVDDVEYDIEQNNIPDYMSYHLDTAGRFADFLAKYPTISFENVDRFQICSDGIKSIGISQFLVSDLNPWQMLLHPPTSPNYLQRMWNKLHMNHFTISDDLSIISYVKDEQGENP